MRRAEEAALCPLLVGGVELKLERGDVMPGDDMSRQDYSVDLERGVAYIDPQVPSTLLPSVRREIVTLLSLTECDHRDRSRCATCDATRACRFSECSL